MTLSLLYFKLALINNNNIICFTYSRQITHSTKLDSTCENDKDKMKDLLMLEALNGNNI